MSETPSPIMSESDEQMKRRYTDPKIEELKDAIKEEGVVKTGIGNIRKRLPRSSVLSQQVVEAQQSKISENIKQIIELKKIAETDDLTEIANRRGFFEIAPQILTKAKESGTDTVLFMIDLDRFKKINDRWGHSTGDKVLKIFAQAMQNTFREPDLPARVGGDELDLPARVGGEEFSVLLTGLKAEDAVNVAKRLDKSYKELIESGTDLSDELKNEGCRLSIGATEVTSEDFENGIPQLEKIMKRADAILYMVKESGRNGIAIDDGEQITLRDN